MERLLLFIGVGMLAFGLAGIRGCGEADVRMETDAAPLSSKPSASSRSTPSAMPARIGNGVARHRIARAPDGHFYADARVNGARLEMMIDTGATMVVLSRADARAAGISLSRSGYTARADTAGGEIALHPVTIDRLALGPLVARRVPAMVAEDLPVSLLGQSFLERVGNVEISDDEMLLR